MPSANMRFSVEMTLEYSGKLVLNVNKSESSQSVLSRYTGVTHR